MAEGAGSLAVNIPEKTLEHWVSMYITYRFRSKAALWWPTQGEDVDVRALPQRPGKAIQLEVKTVSPGAGGSQDVNIDIGQLWEYLRRPCPPFYVFPWPTWSGALTVAAAGATPLVPVTEIAFSRSQDWWFALWVRVLTAQQVGAVLASELAAHGKRDRGNIKRLVRIRTDGSPPEWGAKGTASPPVAMDWRDFWSTITWCGAPGWPQIIRLPARVLGGGSSFALLQLRAELVALGSGVRERGGKDAQARSSINQVFDDLVTLAPVSDGSYTIIPDEVKQPEAPRQDDDASASAQGGETSISDRRQVAFLDAGEIVEDMGSV